MAHALPALAHAAALATPSTPLSPAVLPSGDSSGWTLDVRAAEVPGWFEEPSGRMAQLFSGCGEGRRNAAESECFAAATEAAQKDGRSVRGFMVVDDGARAGVPSGCSYSRVSGTAMFYRNAAGRYGSGYELVCVEDRSPQEGKRADRPERFPRLRDVGPGESSTCADVLPGEGWSTQDYAAGLRVVYERAPTRSTQALALVLRGDMFRGSPAAGIQCAQSIQDSIVTPALQGATGVATAVDSFLSVYAESDGSVWEQYARPINASIALVSVVKRSSQLGGIATAIESWRSYAERHEEAQYTAVLLLRYDLHWKAGITDYLRDARFLGDQLQQGVAFLWREVNGEYMYGSDLYGPFPESWRENLRVPDTAQAFSSGYYADCFLRLVKAQPFEQNFLHTMLEGEGMAQLTDLQREDGRLRYLVDNGVFDSNPCRKSCFLNPLYDLLPRNSWLVQHGICRARSDFLLDEATGTLCCPSPDNCCPNTARACQAQCTTEGRTTTCTSNAVRYQGPLPSLLSSLHHNLGINDL